MTNFEKWKQELTLSQATDMLGELVALRRNDEGCIIYCPKTKKRGIDCEKVREGVFCNDIIRHYFMEESK